MEMIIGGMHTPCQGCGVGWKECIDNVTGLSFCCAVHKHDPPFMNRVGTVILNGD